MKDLFAEALLEYEGGRLACCRVMLDELLTEQKQHVPGLILSGIVAGQQRELDEALQAFERVLAIQPENPRAHFNKANILLLRGDWEEGWRHYEWRWQLAEFSSWCRAASPPPMWSGQPLQGKTILVRCEQGLGDTLQFCRYVKPLAERGAHVILEAQRPLVSLLADLDGLGQIVTQGTHLPECDYYCALLSLPLAFRTTVATVPQPQAYLTADQAKVAEWRARLGERTTPRVGLVWRGTAVRANDGRRSLPLKALLTHLPAGFEYVSLQKQLDAEELQVLRNNPQVVNFAHLLHDFSDTAALTECMDVVVTIDTSVAHLSAALGKKTLILLQFSPAWRWLLDREESPWYRTARLVRQSQPDEWTSVCERAGQLLNSGQ